MYSNGWQKHKASTYLVPSTTLMHHHPKTASHCSKSTYSLGCTKGYNNLNEGDAHILWAYISGTL